MNKQLSPTLEHSFPVAHITADLLLLLWLQTVPILLTTFLMLVSILQSEKGMASKIASLRYWITVILTLDSIEDAQFFLVQAYFSIRYLFLTSRVEETAKMEVVQLLPDALVSYF